MSIFIVSSAITSSGTSATYNFNGKSGRYEFGYQGTLGGASFTLQFRNGSTDEWKDATGVAAISASNTSQDIMLPCNQDLRVVTSGAGGSTSFKPQLLWKGVF